MTVLDVLEDERVVAFKVVNSKLRVKELADQYSEVLLDKKQVEELIEFLNSTLPQLTDDV
jgi:hypothetical protein